MYWVRRLEILSLLRLCWLCRYRTCVLVGCQSARSAPVLLSRLITNTPKWTKMLNVWHVPACQPGYATGPGWQSKASAVCSLDAF